MGGPSSRNGDPMHLPYKSKQQAYQILDPHRGSGMRRLGKA